MSRTNGYIGRRDFIKLAGIVALSSSLLLGSAALAQESTSQTISSTLALQKLIEDNTRFVQHKQQNLHQLRLCSAEIALVQHPFVSILSTEFLNP